MKILFIQTNYPNFLNSFYKKNNNLEKFSYKKIKRLWANEFFGSSNFYLKNLKRLGWTGNEIVLNDWVSQSLWMKEHGYEAKRKEIPFLNLLPLRLRNYLSADRWIKEFFFKQIKYYRPDVTYIHDLSVFTKKDLKKIKKFSRLVVGQIAYPLHINQNILKGYDLIISSLPNFVNKFKKMKIQSEYLRWCVEKTVPKIIGRKERKYDVVYVGGFTPHHSIGNKILEETAKKIKIDFWGYGENFLSPLSSIKKTFHGQAWGKDMYKIFSQSKIVINRHINISGKYANNMRMFDATAMGALLITDAKSNMNEFFKVGEEVVVYNNAKDLINKVKYYLAHKVKRQKIAKAGQNRTLKDHTYALRMKTLDKILRKFLIKRTHEKNYV